ncbi:carboxymuconolactone decarboxylase family protein [Shewanella sp. FJAT-51649]|uniref:carboxymuconolactone decarboxylase family protein n=1 Tax=Shewanella sp. FJAT-51649 TaxID=2864210 RepID=UPI001C6598BB|nr:carboxymuconolactone decarboxylase family protein [Shewanella sp. FJAT-51649]QYJ70875.1 carboxymuconolactone decarboxylase family protein [Shewanella sp. FJAT-51649]
MNDKQYEKGLEVRRAVMGDSFVDNALSSATDFTRPLQELVTANCWGEVWVREGLSRQTRSLVTIATLAALKAPTELKGHVRGALRNGCTVEEIQEVLLHSTLYCGMPSGIEAFRAAKEVIEEWQAEQAKVSGQS